MGSQKPEARSQKPEARSQSKEQNNLIAYSGYYKEREKLLQSASGGAASIISEGFINSGGLVIGASYSKDFKQIEFSCAENLSELEKFKGSKYAESIKKILVENEYISVFEFIEKKLISGEKVLFTGLGCDIAGLFGYLKTCDKNKNKNIDYKNLFTIDLICYGSTLKEVHSQYINYLEKKFNSRIKKFTVRYKKTGWVPPYVFAEFENGKIFTEQFYNSEYGHAFAKFARPGCYSCNFRGENHKSDITVCDFWGLEKICPVIILMVYRLY